MLDKNRISVTEFAQIKDDKDIFLLDVRTLEEFNQVNLGGNLIPNYEIANRLDEIPLDKRIIVMCHHGIRSMQIVGFLLSNNYTNIQNLTGGIDKYAIEIDSALPRY
jgi:rhodanese-related sulfurtransferase